MNIKFHGEKVDNFTTGDRFGREEQNRLNEGRNQEHSTGSSQPGRPKEHPYGSVSAYRKKEYEEEMNPFENRYSSGRSIQTGTSDQPDYGNTPRG